MPDDSITLGGAHIDEKGNAYGGTAGDQTGREVGESSFYIHKLGWRVFRAKRVQARILIAQAMRWACANPNIGYDQYQRDSLYNAAAVHGFNPQLVDKPVETDCSALVRVCCAYAGIRLPNFRTWNEPRVLLESGAFTEVPFSRAALRAGDILCTPSAGHTEVVVWRSAIPADEEIMPTIRIRDKGHAVSVLQALLNQFAGAALVVDGDYGPKTAGAVEMFQRANGLYPDGICGPNTWNLILKGEER